jgi:ABC-type amino acid transport system permease subunit
MLGEEFRAAVAGTVTLWATSSILAVILGLSMTAGSLSTSGSLHAVSRTAVNVLRGVPTSLFVVTAGIVALRVPSADAPLMVFPGTPPGFQALAWAVVLAVALGGAGHFAEIFRAARAALGHARLEQAQLLGLSRPRRALLLLRETAAVALPPTGTRLVHQLHNTAFAALFPVTDLFGFVQLKVNETFAVTELVLAGCLAYVALSALIWLGVRALEAALLHRVARLPRVRGVMA